MDPTWLSWARKLQALAQNGLLFSDDPFDRERYEQVLGTALEMLESGSGLDAAAVRSLSAQETGYATPKVDVRGAVFREGRILLVRERSDGRWTLPGGWADVNDAPSETVERFGSRRVSSHGFSTTNGTLSCRPTSTEAPPFIPLNWGR